MTPEEQVAKVDASERKETLPVLRGAVGSTVAEDVSFINVREVSDWCREAREYRPPLLSSATLFSLSLGLLVGFAPAYAATDVQGNGVWKGLFLAGAILGGVGCVLSLFSMVFELRRRSDEQSQRRPTPLQRLASRMEGACEKGLLRAAAAEAALRERQEKERAEGEPVA